MCGKQTDGYQVIKGGDIERLGFTYKHYTAICKISNLQAPTVYHKELSQCSIMAYMGKEPF